MSKVYKKINLLSISFAHKDLSIYTDNSFGKFMQTYGILKNPKPKEITCIRSLVNEIINIKDFNKAYIRNYNIFDDFYSGYSIPNIGKEFDLIRFGDNYIVNIELKSEFDAVKINKQQLSNNFYLNCLGQTIYIYTYVEENNKLYKLEGSESIEADLTELTNLLSKQSVIDITNIDELFHPTIFLANPFNSTDKFIDDEYFFTNNQIEILNKITDQLEDSTTNFISITGEAGTGKTLLCYHIAKEYIKKKKNVKIVHCGILNAGQKKLRDDHSWDINMTNHVNDISNCDILIIDEAQRIEDYKLKSISNQITALNKKCIFSFDEKQYLKESEKKTDFANYLQSNFGCKIYKLTNTIRTNEEISKFTKQLFDNKINNITCTYTNIDLRYSPNNTVTRIMINNLYDKGWKTPNYTPGTRSSFKYEAYESKDRDTAHSIIGQEFEKIVIVLDDNFSYNEEGKLVSNKSYYIQSQMLYQIITRATKKLCVIIMNNKPLLLRCSEILNQK